MNLEKFGIDDLVVRKLHLRKRPTKNGWVNLLKKIERVEKSSKEIKIGIGELQQIEQDIFEFGLNELIKSYDEEPRPISSPNLICLYGSTLLTS